MKKFVLVLCLGLCAPVVRAQNPTSAAAPAVGAIVNVHVVGAHVVPCGGCSLNLYLEAVIDGKKYELLGSSFVSHKLLQGTQINSGALLPPGDYQAKLTKDLRSTSGMFYQEYELLLPDHKSVWKCAVTGIEE